LWIGFVGHAADPLVGVVDEHSFLERRAGADELDEVGSERSPVIDSHRKSRQTGFRAHPPNAEHAPRTFTESAWHAAPNGITSVRPRLGINGIAKNRARAALDDPDRRRIRGVAAQSIFAALSLKATNLQQIQSFLTRAKADVDGVLRSPRRRRRTTRSITDWMPPKPALSGAPPP
jgi:hypothetical protein